MAKPLHIDARAVARTVEEARSFRPSVHCITNTVAQNFTANVLLAIGMRPSMTVALDEISGFVKSADALLINLGTMDEDRRTAIDDAIAIAQERNLPWVLDPTFVEKSEPRQNLAKQLVGRKPTALRFNPGEGQYILGAHSSEPHALTVLSRSTGSALVMTGAEDVLAVDDDLARVRNGSPLMDRVTAMGCALSAVVAGFLAAENDRQLAIVSALVLYGLAGSEAETRASGPGSFVPAFLDALYALSADDIIAGARIA
ncbi:MAG: hydroxyethylthiazole kinase [Pseudomonadota bacterium]